LYALTASRSVGWEDSAFFQLSHAVLGVPHGPGFPLYVLLGRVFVIPFASAAAWGSNLFSGLTVAAAGVVLLEIMLVLAGRHHRASADRDVASQPWAVAGALGVVLGWGTLTVVWQQSVRTEVYGLVLLCSLLTAYLSLKALERWQDAPAAATRVACAAAFTWGLGLAVHPLIALAAATPWLVPLCVRLRRRPQSLLVLALSAAVPLSLYLYPAVRGQVEGIWAWGSFGSLSAHLDYYLRRSAWAAVTSIDGGVVENMRGWLHTFPGVWPAGLWLPTVVALFWLRRQWPLFIALGATTCLVVWAAPFDPKNLDLFGYFLPAVSLCAVAVGVFVVRAVLFFRAQMPGLEGRSRLALGMFAASLMLGWPTASIILARDIRTPAAGAHELVNALALSLPERATLLATDDNLLGMMEYAQRVEGLRPDLKVIAPGALRYPFYRDQVRAHLPKRLTARWQSRRVWDRREWEEAMHEWRATMSAADRVFTPLQAIPGIEPIHLRPAGFVYALSTQQTPILWRRAAEFWKTAPQLSHFDPVARAVMARWTFNFGSFAITCGQDDIGWAALLAAVHLTPHDPEIYFLIGRALARADRQSDAQAMFAAAVELAPYRERYRSALQTVSRRWAVQP
jgi:hypothetical protein